LRKGKATDQFVDDVIDTIGKGVTHYLDVPPSIGSPSNKCKSDENLTHKAWHTLGTWGTQNNGGCNAQTTGGATKTTANNKLNDMNDMNYWKEMAVGQSKSKLSWKINEWSHHSKIEDNIPPEQQRRAAATTKEEKLVPPLLDNGGGKQQCLDIDYKSTRDKFNEKEEQTNKQPMNDMASMIEQSKGLVAKAKHQASPTHQCGINHNRSLTPTPQGAATLFNKACPMVKKPQKEIPNNLGTRIHKCPSPTINIPNKGGTSQEVMRNMEG
jgi:hypothetical protein